MTKSIRSVAIFSTFFAYGALASSPAFAASSACSLIGMFDSRAKALCEAAARSSQSAPNTATQNSAQPGQDGGYNRGNGGTTNVNDGQYPLAPPSPPAPGMYRYAIAKDWLFVDLGGNYPQGYSPAWRLTGTTPQQISANRYNILNHGPQGTATFFVSIVSDQGRPALQFGQRGSTACLADIVGLPQVMTDRPKQFQLANFRYVNNQGPQCQRTLGATDAWRGSVTLSANANGDISLSLLLDQALPSGQPWFEFNAQNLPFNNLMTPQMAAADVEHKAQIAAANTAREKVAASERAEATARIAALPHAGPVYSRQMAAYVLTDSLGWAGANGGFGNHLDAGSVGNVRIFSGSVASGRFILRAEYTFNGGRPGWVVAQYVGGKFNCIQFWDAMVGCRTLRKPGDGAATVASITTAAMSGSSGSSGNNTGLTDSQEGFREHMREQQDDRDFQQYHATPGQ